jgi:ABC-type cobalt transport system substrate-binding protein
VVIVLVVIVLVVIALVVIALVVIALVEWREWQGSCDMAITITR